MPDPDPAPPAFIKMGDFASRSKDERIECGMTPFYEPRSIFYESNSGYKYLQNYEPRRHDKYFRPGTLLYFIMDIPATHNRSLAFSNIQGKDLLFDDRICKLTAYCGDGVYPTKSFFTDCYHRSRRVECACDKWSDVTICQ